MSLNPVTTDHVVNPMVGDHGVWPSSQGELYPFVISAKGTKGWFVHGMGQCSGLYPDQKKPMELARKAKAAIAQGIPWVLAG